MNIRVGNTAVINYRKNNVFNPLESIEIGFEDEVLTENYEAILETCEYWVESAAIAEVGTGRVEYVNYNTVCIRANFSGGYFDGDLFHHNAIGFGDDNFNIGLLRLFLYGNKPKTTKGKTIKKIGKAPVYVKFVYEGKQSIRRKLAEITLDVLAL